MVNIISLEEGTCTDRAIEMFLDQLSHRFFQTRPEIVYQPTFDDMIAYTKAHPGDILFLPQKRVDLNNKLVCAAHWRDIPELVFSLPNPPLYLADGGEDPPGQVCATLETLQTLVRGEVGLEFVEASNTQDAARKVHGGEADLCITNEHAIELYKLRIRRQLAEIIMFWMPYVYDENADITFDFERESSRGLLLPMHLKPGEEASQQTTHNTNLLQHQ
ncbi:hypothetical protein HOE67_01535 [Candidatus Peregrinibacteria bacterium]|jgi:hypothetical protein|nr:hypothetical protein [Candidatus Peregrinibacteria bacterium]MBT4055769.1 hypothetical protein [Candidatus Peregrinibacteria bacterium]